MAKELEGKILENVGSQGNKLKGELKCALVCRLGGC